MPNQIVPAADIVSVFIYGRRDHRAECTCGLDGKRRRTKAGAVIDALLHAWDTGHRENWPLVYNEAAPRRSPARAGIAALAIASAILGAAFYLASPAQADPADDYAAINYPVMCEAIAERPYVSTVETVIAAIMADTGESPTFAGAALGVAVCDYCPWNRGPIERYIEKYVPSQPAASWQQNGAMGGRIA